MSSQPKVVVIGAGPAGISTAIECIEMGLKPEDIAIFEKGATAIDAIRKFYPDKKMTLANYKGLPTETLGHIPTFPELTKPQTIDYFEELIKKYDLRIRYQSEVYKINSSEGGLTSYFGKENVESPVAVIGIGILGRPNKPAYKLPTSLRNHLLFDITSQAVENQDVVVVGGGDTSSEYAQVLVQQGNKVTMICRAQNLSRMMETNQKALESLQSKGAVSLHLGMEVVEVVDESGKPRLKFSDEGRLPSRVFDKVIFAIGGSTPINFLRTAGIQCEKDWPVYSESGRTNIPGLYLAGDLVAGKTGGSIITAYNSSFRAANEFVPQLKSRAL